MNGSLATAGRVLAQLRNDKRTIGLILVVPCVLMGLLAWIYHDNQPQLFDRIGPALLGLFPLVVMFIVTSISTLRERRSGTLERLWTTPVTKPAFVAGYAVAFGVMSALQAVIVVAFSIWVCGLDLQGQVWQLVVVAVLTALLGTCLGLLASGFARTEFQAVQFMPALILPQFLLCGLLVPRDQLPRVLHWVSDVLPLSYVVDAMKSLATSSDSGGDVARDCAVLVGFIILAVVGGMATLRRRTP